MSRWGTPLTHCGSNKRHRLQKALTDIYCYGHTNNNHNEKKCINKRVKRMNIDYIYKMYFTICIMLFGESWERKFAREMKMNCGPAFQTMIWSQCFLTYESQNQHQHQHWSPVWYDYTSSFHAFRLYAVLFGCCCCRCCCCYNPIPLLTVHCSCTNRRR